MLWRKIDAKTGRKSLEEKLKIETVRLAHKTSPTHDVILTRSGSLDTGHIIWRTPLPEREISQGRHHKNYLDKSKIGSARNLERSFHKILSNAKSPFY